MLVRSLAAISVCVTPCASNRLISVKSAVFNDCTPRARPLLVLSLALSVLVPRNKWSGLRQSLTSHLWSTHIPGGISVSWWYIYDAMCVYKTLVLVRHTLPYPYTFLPRCQRQHSLSSSFMNGLTLVSQLLFRKLSKLVNVDSCDVLKCVSMRCVFVTDKLLIGTVAQLH